MSASLCGLAGEHGARSSVLTTTVNNSRIIDNALILEEAGDRDQDAVFDQMDSPYVFT